MKVLWSCEAFIKNGRWPIRIVADSLGNWKAGYLNWGMEAGRVDTGLCGAKAKAVREAKKLIKETPGEPTP